MITHSKSIAKQIYSCVEEVARLHQVKVSIVADPDDELGKLFILLIDHVCLSII